jgi:hypothetical protein
MQCVGLTIAAESDLMGAVAFAMAPFCTPKPMLESAARMQKAPLQQRAL